MGDGIRCPRKREKEQVSEPTQEQRDEVFEAMNAAMPERAILSIIQQRDALKARVAELEEDCINGIRVCKEKQHEIDALKAELAEATQAALDNATERDMAEARVEQLQDELANEQMCFREANGALEFTRKRLAQVERERDDLQADIGMVMPHCSCCREASARMAALEAELKREREHQCL